MALKVRGLVSGRVQGVGFRYFVKEKAKALDVSGSARNLVDGRVEVILCGNDHAVRQLQQLVQSGPTLSRIDSMTWEEVEIPVSEGFVIS